MKTAKERLHLPQWKLINGIVFLLIATLATPAVMGQTLVIGTFNRDRCGPANLVNGELTEALHWFGEKKTLEVFGFDEIRIVGTDTLSEDFIEDQGVDVLVIHNVWSANRPIAWPLSSEEQDALFDFVENGGAALVIADGGFWDTAPAFVEPFGVELDHHTTGGGYGHVVVPEDRLHEVVDGPFGRVDNFGVDWAGWFEGLGPWAEALAVLDENTKPCLAVIEAEEVGSGSGRVVLMSDTSPLADEHLETGKTLFLNIMIWLAPGDLVFVRGDCNADGKVDLSDAVASLGSLFLGEDAPPCDDACDSNDDGKVDLSDAIYTLTWAFLGGPPPPAPHGACGVDPTKEEPELTCLSFKEEACTEP